MPPVDTKRVPITQAAADLGVPRPYIEHWVKTGQLDTIRFGRRGLHLVHPADVRQLMTGTPPSPELIS